MPHPHILQEAVSKQQKTRTKNRDCWEYIWVILCIILSAFMVLRWTHIASSNSYDFDEVYILKLMIGRPFDFFTGKLFEPGSPPLGLFLVEIWKSTVGSSEALLRLFPILISLGSFFLFATLASRILHRLTAISAVALFSGNGVIWYYGMYLRPYSLLIFLSLATITVVPRLLTQPPPKKSVISISLLIVTTGLYTHYSYLLFLGIFCCVLMFSSHKNIRRLKTLLWTIATSVLLFLPWCFVFIKQQLTPTSTGNRYFFHQLLEGWIGFDGWLSVFSNGTSTFLRRNILENTIGVLFAVLFLVAGSKVVPYLKKHGAQYYILITTLLSVFLLFFTPVHAILTEPRYWIFLLPILFLSIGIIVDTVGKTRLTICFLLSSIALLPFTSAFAQKRISSWHHLALTIPSMNPDSLILFDPCDLGYVFSYQYSGTIPLACLAKKPEGLPYPIWDRTPHQTMYVIKNTNNFGLEEKLYYDLLKTYSYQIHTFGSTELVIMNIRAQ